MMNPGPVDEAGKAVLSFMDSMKAQPLALALVVMNFVLLGYLFYSERQFQSTREQTGQRLIEWQSEVNKLLANCVPLRDLQDMLKSLGLNKPGDPK